MKSLTKIFFVLLLSFTTTVTFAQDSPEVRKENFNLKDNVAISGYDAVSYFTGNPKKGNKEYQKTYKGVTYYFSSEKNKNSFAKNSAKYEPQYGGWCAYAMASEKADKVPVNPKTYKVIDNKLYLYYNKFGINTLDKWNEEDGKKLKTKADKNWSEIIH